MLDLVIIFVATVAATGFAVLVLWLLGIGI